MKFFDKIIERIADKCYNDNKEKILKKMDWQIDMYIKRKLKYDVNFYPERWTEEYFYSKIQEQIQEMIIDSNNIHSKSIENGINEDIIYNQIQKVLSKNVEQIVEYSYKHKIEEVVNEILNKIKISKIQGGFND